MSQAAVGAFFHTPGPKEVYVLFRQEGTWQFVGTAVTAPAFGGNPKYIDIFNDYGGRSVPTQLLNDGQDANMVVTLNRVDLQVCRNIRDVRHTGALTTVGREDTLIRGSLAVGLTDFQLFFKNTYFGTANATPGLIPGRLYFSTVVADYRESTEGTRVEEVSFAFRFNNLFVGSGGVGFALFTEAPLELPLALTTPN